MSNLPSQHFMIQNTPWKWWCNSVVHWSYSFIHSDSDNRWNEKRNLNCNSEVNRSKVSEIGVCHGERCPKRAFLGVHFRNTCPFHTDDWLERLPQEQRVWKDQYLRIFAKNYSVPGSVIYCSICSLLLAVLWNVNRETEICQFYVISPMSESIHLYHQHMILLGTLDLFHSES